jgi:hypothetical protein
MGKFSSYRANELSLREERDRRICGYGYKYIDAIDKCVSYGGGADLPERPKAKGQKRSKTNVQPSDIQGNPAPQAAPQAQAMQAVAKEVVSRKRAK